MRRTAQDHGVSLAGISARKFSEEDLDDFDYIFAMDRSNLRDIESMTWTKHHAEVALFRSLDPEAEGSLDVPDPYYGRDDGSARVVDIVDRTCDVILKRVRADIGESESGNS